MHFHPSFTLLIAAALMFGAFFLPYLNYHVAPSGVWFASINGRRTARAAARIADQMIASHPKDRKGSELKGLVQKWLRVGPR